MKWIDRVLDSVINPLSLSAYYPEVPLLEVPQTRPGSSMSDWVKKHSPLAPPADTEAVIRKLDDHEYDMDCPDVADLHKEVGNKIFIQYVKDAEDKISQLITTNFCVSSR